MYHRYIFPVFVRCQCPHGLMPHFYCKYMGRRKETQSLVSMPSRAYASFLPIEVAVLKGCDPDVCQCPHGLMPHFYSRQSCSADKDEKWCVNALTGLCLISTEYYKYFYRYSAEVSMPSRAYASFLQYPFKNLGFMRFPEPVFAGICQNILTVTHFHAC